MAGATTLDGIEDVLIVGGACVLAYFLYQLLSGLGSSQTGQAADSLAASAVQIPATGLNTIVGTDGAASTPGTDSNLFYSGVDNLIDHGSIYPEQSQPAAPTMVPSPPWYAYIPL